MTPNPFNMLVPSLALLTGALNSGVDLNRCKPRTRKRTLTDKVRTKRASLARRRNRRVH